MTLFLMKRIQMIWTGCDETCSPCDFRHKLFCSGLCHALYRRTNTLMSSGCVAALQRLRGCEDVDEELCEMHVEDQSERAEGRLSVLNLLTFRSLRWQLLSVIIMNMGQQLSGVNAVSKALKYAIYATNYSHITPWWNQFSDTHLN